MSLAYSDWAKEIEKKDKFYSENFLLNLLKHLAAGLSLMQHKNIVHRDIKPQNILILNDSNSNKVYKLADFGEAKELMKDERPTNKQQLRGTELYM